PLMVVELKPGAEPTDQRQYFIPRKAQVGIQKHLERLLLEYGILRPCRSPWNTPLLPVQKPGTDDYQAVQDLRAVNQVTVTIHPVVPNPYTLLGLIPAEATFFTCLDLKDAFFCIRLAPQSQLIFAFQWEDPKNGDRGQLTWTRLPQGLKNSPTIFGTALASDLEAF
ncbi:POK19 protein, partial [Crocuta crocuta]